MNSSSPSRNRSSTAYSSPKSKISYLKDPEMISLREALDDGQDIVEEDTDTLEKLYVHLREYEAEQVAKEDYEHAQRARERALSVKEELIARQRQLRAASAPGTAICSSRERCEDKWKREAERFDKETEEKRARLLEIHKQNVTRLNYRWENEMPQRYRKPSFRLLQLKETERALARSGDYARATNMHEEAEMLTKSEQVAAQKKLISDYKAALQHIYAKQALELSNFEAARADARRALEAKCASEMSAASNRDNVVMQKRAALTRGSARPGNYARVVVPVQKRASMKQTLLPPLKPPMDPSIEAEEEKKKKRSMLLMRKMEGRYLSWQKPLMAEGEEKKAGPAPPKRRLGNAKESTSCQSELFEVDREPLSVESDASDGVVLPFQAEKRTGGNQYLSTTESSTSRSVERESDDATSD